MSEQQENHSTINLDPEDVPVTIQEIVLSFFPSARLRSAEMIDYEHEVTEGDVSAIDEYIYENAGYGYDLGVTPSSRTGVHDLEIDIGDAVIYAVIDINSRERHEYTVSITVDYSDDDSTVSYDSEEDIIPEPVSDAMDKLTNKNHAFFLM